MKAELVKLTKQVILKYISEEEIFERYFGNKPELHILYTNDKLRKDSTPGCVFYYRDSNKLIFNDFAWGREFDCFDYVSSLNNNCNFPRTLEIIAKDFGLIERETLKLNTEKKELIKIEKVYNSLEITRKRKFFEEDLKYWDIANLGVTEEILKQYKIYAIRHLWEHLGNETRYYNNLQLTFAYHWEGYNYQIYFPLREKGKERKFINTHGIKYGDIEFIDWNANHLVITKSKKDAFYLRLLGVNVFFIIHEAIKLDEQTQNILKQFPMVFTLFDNDLAGVKATRRYRDTYNTIPLFYSKEDGKDTYDVLKKYDKYYLIDLIQQVKRDYNI